VVEQHELGEGVGLDPLHGLLDAGVVPLEALGVAAEPVKVLGLEGAGAARLVLVALLVVEAVKVVGRAKVGIEKDLAQHRLVELGGVELGADLVGRDSREGRQDARKQAPEPPRRPLEDFLLLLHVGVREAGGGPLLHVEPDDVAQPRQQQLGGGPPRRP
jgi:hypothetical protein